MDQFFLELDQYEHVSLSLYSVDHRQNLLLVLVAALFLPAFRAVDCTEFG